MKEMETINLKEHFPAADAAIATLDIELPILKLAGVKVIKVIHGYGSHGTGGLIFQNLKQYLHLQKRLGLVKDVFFGSEWNIANPKVFDLCLDVPDCALDSDLKFSNPGITVIVLNEKWRKKHG